MTSQNTSCSWRLRLEEKRWWSCAIYVESECSVTWSDVDSRRSEWLRRAIAELVDHRSKCPHRKPIWICRAGRVWHAEEDCRALGNANPVEWSLLAHYCASRVVTPYINDLQGRNLLDDFNAWLEHPHAEDDLSAGGFWHVSITARVSCTPCNQVGHVIRCFYHMFFLSRWEGVNAWSATCRHRLENGAIWDSFAEWTSWVPQKLRIYNSYI